LLWWSSIIRMLFYLHKFWTRSTCIFSCSQFLSFKLLVINFFLKTIISFLILLSILPYSHSCTWNLFFIMLNKPFSSITMTFYTFISFNISNLLCQPDSIRILNICQFDSISSSNWPYSTPITRCLLEPFFNQIVYSLLFLTWPMLVIKGVLLIMNHISSILT